MSARESNCAPRLELALSALATNPSKKSKTKEMMMQTAATL